jgi:hypothetical protein
MRLSLTNTFGLSSSVRIAHIVRFWKFFLAHYTQVLCQHRLCIADHVYHVTEPQFTSYLLFYHFARTKKKTLLLTIPLLLLNRLSIFIFWRIYQLLGNGSVNTFPRKRTRAIERSLLGNGSVNKLSQQYRGGFLRGPCRGVIKGERRSLELSRNGSSSGDGSLSWLRRNGK